MILIGRVPDCAALFEGAQQPPQILVRQRWEPGALAFAAHYRFVEWILVGAVHGMERLMPGDEASAQLQGGKMAGQQDDALAAIQRLLQMLEALDLRQAAQFVIGRPPGHGGFKQACAEGGEMRFQQRCPLRRGQFRETQFQVDLGDAPPPPGDLADPAADLPTQHQLPGKWQRRHELHQSQPQPDRPVARRQKMPIKQASTCRHRGYDDR